MVPAGGDTQHSAHRGPLVLGSVRSHELEDLPGAVPVSRANPCRGFLQNLPLLAKPAILPAQPPQLLALGARQTVLATPFIAVRLTDPVAHRLRRALELASQLSGRATRPHQSDAHTIWRRYSGAQGGTSFCHRDPSSAQWSGVHESGATPGTCRTAAGPRRRGAERRVGAPCRRCSRPEGASSCAASANDEVPRP